MRLQFSNSSLRCWNIDANAVEKQSNHFISDMELIHLEKIFIIILHINIETLINDLMGSYFIGKILKHNATISTHFT